MPDTAQTAAPDQEFNKLSPQDQHQYLLDTDPDYKSLAPHDQVSYLHDVQGPTNFEKQNTPAPMESGGALERSVKGIGRGIGNLAEGAYNTVRHPIDTASSMFSNAKDELGQVGSEPSTIGKIAHIGNAIPGLGPLGKSLGERAATGDVAGAVSEGLTTAAGPSALHEAVAPIGRGIRNVVGRVETAPAVDIPGTRGTVKFRIRPEPPPDPLDTAIAEGRAAKIPIRMPKPNPLPVIPDPLDTAIAEGRAAKIPSRMPKTTPPPDPLDTAISEGRAAKIPIRMPRTEPTVPYVPPALDKVPLEQAPIGPQINPPGPQSEIPSRMPKPNPLPVIPDPLDTAIAEGRANKIPSKMPKPNPLPVIPDPLDVAIREGRAGKVPVRMPKPAAEPEPLPTSQGGTRIDYERNQRLNRQALQSVPNRGSNRGSSGAASGSIGRQITRPLTPPADTSVGYLGEPTRPASGRGEGSQAWSLQRGVTPELQDAASRGDPDAIAVLLRLNNKPRLLIPRPTIGSTIGSK